MVLSLWNKVFLGKRSQSLCTPPPSSFKRRGHTTEFTRFNNLLGINPKSPPSWRKLKINTFVSKHNLIDYVKCRIRASLIGASLHLGGNGGPTKASFTHRYDFLALCRFRLFSTVLHHCKSSNRAIQKGTIITIHKSKHLKFATNVCFSVFPCPLSRFVEIVGSASVCHKIFPINTLWFGFSVTASLRS